VPDVLVTPAISGIQKRVDNVFDKALALVR